MQGASCDDKKTKRSDVLRSLRPLLFAMEPLLITLQGNSIAELLAMGEVLVSCDTFVVMADTTDTTEVTHQLVHYIADR